MTYVRKVVDECNVLLACELPSLALLRHGQGVHVLAEGQLLLSLLLLLLLTELLAILVHGLLLVACCAAARRAVARLAVFGGAR